jgi:hypothetical protein
MLITTDVAVDTITMMNTNAVVEVMDMMENMNVTVMKKDMNAVVENTMEIMNVIAMKKDMNANVDTITINSKKGSKLWKEQ